MTLFSIVLFLHVGFAVLLVGGSFAQHLAHGHMHRARTVDGARTTAGFIAAFSKVGGPLAAGTFLAGVYLTTAAGRWGDPWLIVSLVLFVLAGAGFGTVLDPGSKRQLELLNAAPDGVLDDGLRAELHDARYEQVLTVLAGADAAIVFLMTNKPGLTGSLVAAAVGLGAATLVAVAQTRRHRADRPGDTGPMASPA